MQVTDVKVQLTHQPDNKLKAFCIITLDNSFLVREIKVIETNRGGVFVAMPSRKMTDRCKCGCKNEVTNKFCCGCGHQMDTDRAVKNPQGRLQIYTDIVRPVTSECHQMIQHTVINAYKTELNRTVKRGG